MSRETLREQAYRYLSDLLTSGRLGPGEKISLRKAADSLGVSVMPVREAVSRLVADNALEVTPAKAVRVPVMSRAQFIELTSVRIAVEGHAAAEAAIHHTAAALDQIIAAETEFRDHSAQPNPDVLKAVELNSRFHFAIYQAARSPLLVQLIRGLWLKAGPVITLDVRENPQRLAESSSVRHTAMLHAIRARNPTAARSGLSADISVSADYILKNTELSVARKMELSQ